jgi:formylmethanofuran dehydrogenase subunit E
MESTTMIFQRPFEGLLEESVRVHWHLYAGQVLDVRLAALGLRLMGIDVRQGRLSFLDISYKEIGPICGMPYTR